MYAQICSRTFTNVFNLFIKHYGSSIIIPCDKIGNRSSNPLIEKYAEECVKNKKNEVGEEKSAKGE